MSDFAFFAVGFLVGTTLCWFITYRTAWLAGKKVGYDNAREDEADKQQMIRQAEMEKIVMEEEYFRPNHENGNPISDLDEYSYHHNDTVSLPIEPERIDTTSIMIHKKHKSKKKRKKKSKRKE